MNKENIFNSQRNLQRTQWHDIKYHVFELWVVAATERMSYMQHMALAVFSKGASHPDNTNVKEDKHNNERNDILGVPAAQIYPKTITHRCKLHCARMHMLNLNFPISKAKDTIAKRWDCMEDEKQHNPSKLELSSNPEGQNPHTFTSRCQPLAI